MLLTINNRSKLPVFIILLLLGACSQPPVVPVDEQSFAQPKKTQHITGSGDTLYSIAFLAGLDYREVAAWNNIRDPYTIHRGQRISLVKPKNFTQQIRNQDIIQPIKTNPRPVIIQQPEPQTDVVKLNPEPTRTQHESQKHKYMPFNNSWQWPIAAMSIVNYKKSGQNNGLDIISRRGIPVRASASGKVVYAGNGLKGYGNLIIIKHDDTYLSAYAHNRSIAVKEGEQVTQGQKIAEVGSSDANQAKLHFEIRKNGKPVSPLGLLPKKVG